MKIGTKSLLFGCHQVLIHGIYVLLAWRRIYPERPWYMMLHPARVLAAFVHDLGYWGCPNIDGPAGESHPSTGAAIMLRFTRNHYWYAEVLLHSQDYARRMQQVPSNMCWADKLATAMMPSWLWAALAYLSGEGWEYLQNPKYPQYRPDTPLTYTSLRLRHKDIRVRIRNRMLAYGLEV